MATKNPADTILVAISLIIASTGWLGAAAAGFALSRKAHNSIEQADVLHKSKAGRALAFASGKAFSAVSWLCAAAVIPLAIGYSLPVPEDLHFTAGECLYAPQMVVNNVIFGQTKLTRQAETDAATKLGNTEETKIYMPIHLIRLPRSGWTLTRYDKMIEASVLKRTAEELTVSFRDVGAASPYATGTYRSEKKADGTGTHWVQTRMKTLKLHV